MSNASKNSKETAANTAAPATNFIRNIIDAELAAGKHAERRWSGKPGLAAQQHRGVELGGAARLQAVGCVVRPWRAWAGGES